MEDNRDWVEAQIAECERQLSTIPETDWLGRVGFTHRLMRMKGILDALSRKAEQESNKPADGHAESEAAVGSGSEGGQGFSESDLALRRRTNWE
jgi:hypothetical protein